MNDIVLHALYFIELRRFPLRCLAMHCTALHYSALNWDIFHFPALDYSALLCTVILPRGANQMIATAQYRNKIGSSLHNSWYNTEWPHMTPVSDNTTNFSCWFPYYRPGRHIWGGLTDKYSQPVWTTVFVSGYFWQHWFHVVPTSAALVQNGTSVGPASLVSWARHQTGWLSQQVSVSTVVSITLSGLVIKQHGRFYLDWVPTSLLPRRQTQPYKRTVKL